VYGRELRKAAYPAEIGFYEELINSMRGTPPMKQDNVVAFHKPEQIEDPLTELLRTGAKRSPAQPHTTFSSLMLTACSAT